MQLTGTGRTVPAEVPVLLQVITEVLFRTDHIVIHHQRFDLIIPIEEIVVMRCDPLPAEVTGLILRDHPGIQDPLPLQGAPGTLEVLEVRQEARVMLEAPEVLQEVRAVLEVLQEVPEVLAACEVPAEAAGHLAEDHPVAAVVEEIINNPSTFNN
jgi:hypothetical protein